MKRVPPKAFVHRAGNDAAELMPEVRHVLTSTQLAFVYGLILGSLPEEKAKEMFASLDSLVRLSKLESGHYHLGARAIMRALREVGLLDQPDPPERRKAVRSDVKRAKLTAAGWTRRKRVSEVTPPSENGGMECWDPPNAEVERSKGWTVSAVTLETAWKTYRKEHL